MKHFMTRESEMDRTATNPTGRVQRDEPWLYGTPKKNLFESVPSSGHDPMSAVMKAFDELKYKLDHANLRGAQEVLPVLEAALRGLFGGHGGPPDLGKLAAGMSPGQLGAADRVGRGVLDRQGPRSG